MSAVELSIDVPRAEVHRYLGYGRSRGPEGRIARQLDDLWEPALDLLAPVGAWCLASGADASDAGMPDPSAEVGVGLVTVGPALEQEADRRNDAGDLLDALLLDAIGSAAAEAAADALDRLVCTAAADRGRFTGRRISPGYGKWDVRGQRALLGLLPAGDLGVHLTEGMMMVPRKSVSFAVRLLSERPRKGEGKLRCAGCDLAGCAYRRVGAR